MKGKEIRKEVRGLKDEEISVELDKMQRKLFDLRSQTVTEKIEDPSLFKKTRRAVARLKTERRARVLNQQGSTKETTA
jgi:ribosomal protein L29